THTHKPKHTHTHTHTHRYTKTHKHTLQSIHFLCSFSHRHVEHRNNTFQTAAHLRLLHASLNTHSPPLLLSSSLPLFLSSSLPLFLSLSPKHPPNSSLSPSL